MKIPSRVRIKRGVRYEIVRQTEIDGKPDTLGLCDPNTRHLYIKSDLSKTEEIKTYIHEMLHALEAEWDIKIPHESVYRLEEAIYKFLTLNKLI